MEQRVRTWAKRLKQKRWWLIYMGVYKVLEDRLLAWLNARIDTQAGGMMATVVSAAGYLPWVTWLLIPIVILVLILWAWHESRSEVKTVIAQPTEMPSTDLVQFCPVRPRYSWFRSQVESASEVWAFWHVGTSARNNNLFQTGRVKQLLLANLAHPELKELARITNASEAQLRSDIEETVRAAQEYGAKVKFWEGHIVAPFTIGDPLRPQATWVIAEYVLPFGNADQRPSNLIKEQAVCDRYREAFLQMWNTPNLAHEAPRLLPIR